MYLEIVGTSTTRSTLRDANPRAALYVVPASGATASRPVVVSLPPEHVIWLDGHEPQRERGVLLKHKHNGH